MVDGRQPFVIEWFSTIEASVAVSLLQFSYNLLPSLRRYSVLLRAILMPTSRHESLPVIHSCQTQPQEGKT